MRHLPLTVVAFVLAGSTARCVAQEPSPVFRLSDAEATRAKQTAQDLKSAQDHDTRAATAWRNFNQSFQAAHPDLQNPRFASDFSVAFAFTRASAQFPLSEEATTVELSAEEQRRAASLHQEMVDAKRTHDQAEKHWSDYWHQLVLDHTPTSSAHSGMTVTFSDGRSATIPFPWAGGVVFSSDFKLVLPRSY